MFVVPRKDGSFRSVYSLKPLNWFVLAMQFKMEGLKDLQRMGNWMVLIDLKDAHLHVNLILIRSLEVPVIYLEQPTVQVSVSTIRSVPRVFTKLLKSHT